MALEFIFKHRREVFDLSEGAKDAYNQKRKEVFERLGLKMLAKQTVNKTPLQSET
jgi:hypothetical protein